MSETFCPQCGLALERIEYPSGSWMNEDQWAANRAGDWWCSSCPDNGRGRRGAYFWDSEVKPANVHKEPPYDDIDPGIRETVRWLWEQGFDPCDSGDGVSKFIGASEDDHDPDMFLRIPNVAMMCRAGDVVSEADRLVRLLAARGIAVEPIGPADSDGVSIQATYDPAYPKDGALVLFGVDDARLRGAK